MVNYFPIIQALCRSALLQPNEAVLHQVQRLKVELEKGGHDKEAKALEAMLNSAEANVDMSPSKIKKSFVHFGGELLTKKTPVPVDRETSAPLAEVYFMEDLPEEVPSFDENIQVAIQTIVKEWLKFDRLKEIDALPTSSCLIYGLPGTGKTHLAKWIAREIGMPVVLAKLDGLMSSFLGTTSRNIGNLFSFANRYKCVLLLDEFDAIAKLRNDAQEVGEVKRVVNTLLQSLDGRHERGFTIGVTNHESLLDPAIWRRFDVQIEIPKPSLHVMATLLEKFLKPLPFTDTQIMFLVWCLEGGSGADIEVLSKWLKRSYVMNEEKNLVVLMKQFALLNAGRVETDKRITLLQKDEDILAELLVDKRYTFKQKEVAELFGISQSSVSKHISKHKEIDKN